MGHDEVEPSVAAVRLGREHQVGPHRPDVHHLAQQVLARAVVPVRLDMPMLRPEPLQHPRQVPEIAGERRLTLRGLDPAGLRPLVHQAHRPGKEAEPDPLQEMPRAPAAAHGAGIEPPPGRSLEAPDQRLQRRDEPQRLGDVVGRAHRQDGQRHVPSDQPLSHVADRPVAAGDQHQVARIVEQVLPALVAGAGVGDRKALVREQPHQAVAPWPAGAGLRIVDYGDVGRGPRIVTHR